MPAAPPTPREVVERLDARHEELIRKLDDLNGRIEQALAEFGRSRTHPKQGHEFFQAAVRERYA